METTKVTIISQQPSEKLKESNLKLDLNKELLQSLRSHSKTMKTMRAMMRRTKTYNMKEALTKTEFPCPLNLDLFHKILMKWREELLSLIMIKIQLQNPLKLKMTKRKLNSKKFHLKPKTISLSKLTLTLKLTVYQSFLLEMNRKTKKS